MLDYVFVTKYQPSEGGDDVSQGGRCVLAVDGPNLSARYRGAYGARAIPGATSWNGSWINWSVLIDWFLARNTREFLEPCLFLNMHSTASPKNAMFLTAQLQEGYHVFVQPKNEADSDVDDVMLRHIKRRIAAGDVSRIIIVSHDSRAFAGSITNWCDPRGLDIPVEYLGFLGWSLRNERAARSVVDLRSISHDGKDLLSCLTQKQLAERRVSISRKSGTPTGPAVLSRPRRAPALYQEGGAPTQYAPRGATVLTVPQLGCLPDVGLWFRAARSPQCGCNYGPVSGEDCSYVAISPAAPGWETPGPFSTSLARAVA